MKKAKNIYYINIMVGQTVFTRIVPSKVGTYNADGYRYNLTVDWDTYGQESVHGYYLAVQDANNPNRWPIKETVTSSPLVSSEDIYGLKAGTYIFYISSIDANYKLLDSHYCYKVYVDYSGTLYPGEVLP